MTASYDQLCERLAEALRTHERTAWAQPGVFHFEITISWPKRKRHTGRKALVTPGLWGLLVYQCGGPEGLDNRYQLWAPHLRAWLRDRGLL
jgi:hypothetical protein